MKTEEEEEEEKKQKRRTQTFRYGSICEANLSMP
jgi:hypothetical protein